MSEARYTELQEKTQLLLHGSLKKVRAAALAAVLVPLASVAAVSPAVAQQCQSGGCPPSCPAGSANSTLIDYLGAAGPSNFAVLSLGGG